MSKIKVVTIIGARPQFIKAKPMLDEFNKVKEIDSVVIHTGQHYSYEMSRLFFKELHIPEPDHNLGIGSAPQGAQTGQMLIKIEALLLKEKPDLVLVYGDTNSTLAGALAASKLHIPIAHVEAGMRSFNREMPEEINRVLTDHVSDLLFCSTQLAVDNLRAEGITKNTYLVGDVMYDLALKCAPIAEEKSTILKANKLKAKSYYLATVHRQSNTDNPDNLKNILETLSELDLPVIFPVHPRTKKVIDKLKAYSLQLKAFANIRFIDPVGYLDMLMLEKNACKILTDSGGVQKEAYFFKVPCITLRTETEWQETVSSGWNLLAGTDRESIIDAVNRFVEPKIHKELYGSGNASEEICHILRNMKFDRNLLKLVEIN